MEAEGSKRKMRPVDSGEGSDGSGNSPPHKTPRLSVSAMLGLSFEYTNYSCSHWWGRRLSPLCLPQVLDLTIELYNLLYSL